MGDTRQAIGRTLYLVGVVTMAIASMAASLFGLLVFLTRGFCYDAGSGPTADACVSNAVAFSVVCATTLVIPVVFGIWGHRAMTGSDVGVRFVVCALGYFAVPFAYSALLT